MQHQNFAENRYNTVKTITNTVMDRTGCPPSWWLLCLMYVAYVLNNSASPSLKDQTPLFVGTGQINDISPMLEFVFGEPVYYRMDDAAFPSDSRELLGNFVGIAEHIGHKMTFKVLSHDTQKILARSKIRSALDPKSRNLRMDVFGAGGAGAPTPFVRSRHDGTTDGKPDLAADLEPDGSQPIREPVDGESTASTDATAAPTADGEPKRGMEVFHPSELVGRTFLMDPNEDGSQFQARIIEAIEQHDADLAQDEVLHKFRVSVNDDQYEEILSYNEVVDHFARHNNDSPDTLWKFRRIIAHEGPLEPNHPNYKGSRFNVMLEWEAGEVTPEPLKVVAKDDPVTCAIYAADNNLLDVDGWKQFKRIANRQKKLLRMVNQAKLKSFRTAPRYKYGYEVPRNYDHAVELDRRAGNTKWQDATGLEMAQLDDYNTFQDYGQNARPPEGYKKIRVHLVFDVKHDGRHKARMVADGHLTDVPLDSVYSGVVSLRGLRLMLFLAELNGLETWATDIGNAYLEAETNEKVYIIAGPEFGERRGHLLVIFKALYGLRTSGLRWHERLADCLRDMGFEPCKAEPDIWMRRNGDVYEYIATYVDDLAVAAKDPKSIISALKDKYGFKLKGTDPIAFHLGCDYFRDDTGTLCIAPRKYIDKMISTYEDLFGSKPKQNVLSPLEKGDHPELDTSDLLDEKGVETYLSLIGQAQWAVSLARFDIATAVMTLSGFRVAPRIGHLERVKRLYGYLSKMKHGIIRVRTAEPDYSDLPDQNFDWAYTVYGNVEEIVPDDIPEPLGKHVTMSHWLDANLLHCKMTGRSVTGILDFVNQTPIDWFSKKQATVETATYGSEFVAARTCVERSVELRDTLRYLGVPIRKKAYMFGDNESVVNSSTTPHAKLHKRHNALSFHRVREAIAAKIIGFYHVRSEANVSDILSKHWGYQQAWPLLRPLLFWKGDTKDLIDLKE